MYAALNLAAYWNSMYYTVLTVDHVQKHYESQLKVTVEFTMSKVDGCVIYM